MYIPAYFRNGDIPSILRFMREHPFAVLVNQVDAKPWATHLPLEVFEYPNGRVVLKGHISRANPQAKSFNDKDSILVIFNGPHAYVSSSWYHHVNVPTWNYIAVHVYGKIRILEEIELHAHLKRIVDHFEKDVDAPVSVEKMPAEMMESYIRGIVGFEISMDKIDGKWKLSQNRDQVDYESIIHELEKLKDPGAQAVAEEMKKRPDHGIR